ncbi:MAG: A24 family peptidase [Xanthomonadaceae bacterium]|jgi:leader peptidase (prepilin peptidase)/N-methyltransferase|nr:A24 family peptidase [Xanthomonadaceae bacterium]
MLDDALAVVAAWPATTGGLLGLLVGSFLNVVILRLPPRLMHGWRADARELLELPAATEAAPPNLVTRGSHCPKCGHRLAWWENIPVLSWLALRGRCRACGTAISLQYPLVEIATAVLSTLVALRFGYSAETAVALLVTWVLVALTVIDLRTQLLPDQLTLPLLWLGLLSAAMGLFQSPAAAIAGAAAGYLSLWSVYWVFKLLTGKEGMGYGDFKLLGALGAFCGVMGLLPIILLSSLIGAIVGGTWLAIRGRDRATPIPFGPFLAAAGWVQFMYGDRILALWPGMAPP